MKILWSRIPKFLVCNILKGKNIKIYNWNKTTNPMIATAPKIRFWIWTFKISKLQQIKITIKIKSFY